MAAKRFNAVFKTVLLAGVAGGVAEMLWVAGYAVVTQTSSLEVAREVTASVFPAGAQLALAPLIGIAIHLFLSIVLACVLAKPLLCWLAPRYGSGALMPATLAALVGVWALNFLVILPVLNPAFVTLMPLTATLASKLLFGAAMASVLLSLPVQWTHPSVLTEISLAGLSAQK